MSKQIVNPTTLERIFLRLADELKGKINGMQFSSID